MATKTKRKPKAPPPLRIFFGGELYHSCDYLGKGEASETYHNKNMDDQVESMLTRNITEAAKQIIAENPDTGLLKI